MRRLERHHLGWALAVTVPALIGAGAVILLDSSSRQDLLVGRRNPTEEAADRSSSLRAPDRENGAAHDRAKQDPSSLDGVADATGSLPAPFPADALSFSALMSGNEVALSGAMPAPVRSALVREVRDSLRGARVLDRTETVGVGVLTEDSQAITRFAIAQLAELNSGKLELRQGRLSLQGEAKDKQAVGVVTAALQQPPAGLKTQSPSLTAAAISPFRFTARREAGTLLLTGHLPDVEARESLTRFIRDRFFQERIIDEARLADGAAPGFMDGARIALDQLAQLASGEATIELSQIQVTGESLYPEVAERMRRDLGKALPAGWRSAVQISVREAD